MNKSQYENLIAVRNSFEQRVDQLVNATGELLKPLMSLNNEQRDAVTILGLLAWSITLIKRPPTRMSKSILVRFKDELHAICPPIGEMAISKDPCFEATVAYLSAMQECANEGRSEIECPKAWESAAQTVACAEKMVEDMIVEITVILGNQDPPKPIPKPIKISSK